MRKTAHITVFSIVALVVAAVIVAGGGKSAPQSRVTRAEALATALEYASHQWTPTAANVFHGLDPEGIRVDTPDAQFRPVNDDPGWWRASERNVGLPYKWGGFDTPEAFDQGLRDGKYAGDVYTDEKRRLLDAAVSTRAVGIDCSGFVSRCWRLPRSYSTRELPQLCNPVTDLHDLKPGDIFNHYNDHVRLFAGWTDEKRIRARFYEAEAKVKADEIAVHVLVDGGYVAWRYRGMKD
jgi:hypothetical protein